MIHPQVHVAGLGDIPPAAGHVGCGVSLGIPLVGDNHTGQHHVSPQSKPHIMARCSQIKSQLFPEFESTLCSLLGKLKSLLHLSGSPPSLSAQSCFPAHIPTGVGPKATPQ